MPSFFILLFACEDGDCDDSEESLPSSAEELEVNEEDHEEGEKDTPKAMTAEELRKQCEEKLTTKKEAVSLLVSQLMENPEGNVSRSHQ